MRLKRVAAAAVLMSFVAAAEVASAQCVSSVTQIASRDSQNSLVAGPVAWSGSMLAIASNQTRNGSVWAGLYSEDGTLLYPSIKIPSSDDADILGVFWNGGHFGIFFRTFDDQLILRRLTTTADLLGTAVHVGKLTVRDDDELDILYSTRLNAYVIARMVNAPSRALWLTYVNLDGSVRRNVQVNVTPATNSLVRIAETDSGIIGVWFEADVSRNLTQVRVEEGERDYIRRVWTPNEDKDLVVTSIDNQFVLARTFTQGDGRKTIRWKMVDTLGFDTREEARLLVGTGKDVQPLSMLTRGNELAITYLDARDGFASQTPSFRLRRFDPVSGEAISDTYFAAADRARHRAASEHDFVWTGTAYAAVTVRETDDGDDSFLMRLCPLDADVIGPQQVPVGQTLTLTAEGRGGVPVYNYRWRINERGDVVEGAQLQLRYTTPGTYQVSVSVTDDTDTVVQKTFTIVVYEPTPQTPPKRRSVRK
ncbi:MAG TPA: PKD domain-containing protein [Thermoanaerobaculia bacterium]|nr:PKD domain-containing protein [Thermoanaerobaculia bacterium]